MGRGGGGGRETSGEGLKRGEFTRPFAGARFRKNAEKISAELRYRECGVRSAECGVGMGGRRKTAAVNEGEFIV